jgi:hypothetical protein
MKAPSVKPVRCAIYTRVSTEQGLDQRRGLSSCSAANQQVARAPMVVSPLGHTTNSRLVTALVYRTGNMTCS